MFYLYELVKYVSVKALSLLESSLYPLWTKSFPCRSIYGETI